MTTSNFSLISPSRSAMILALGVLSLAACNPRGQGAQGNVGSATVADAAPPLDALPLTTAAAAPGVLAPTASALPPAPRVRIARVARPGDEYAYLDRAYAQSRAFADAPPDYAYDYDGERPWVWRSNDGAVRVAERLPNGLRYYYYEPGASYPYLVQDPQNSYAYSGGQLVAVYGPDGAVVPYGDYGDRPDFAGRYLARAAALYAASIHQQRQAVEQARWNAERAGVAAEREEWAAQQSQYGAWQAYHDAHDQEEQAHWAAERYRREAEAARYATVVNDQASALQATQAAQQARDLAQRYGQVSAPRFVGGGPNGGPGSGQVFRGQPGYGGPSAPPGLPQNGFAASNPYGQPHAYGQPRPDGRPSFQGPPGAGAQQIAQQHQAEQLAALQAQQTALASARAQQSAQAEAARQASVAQMRAQQAFQAGQARQTTQAQAQMAAQQQQARQAAFASAQAHAQQAAHQQAARQASEQAHAQIAAQQQQAARQTALAAAQAHAQQAAQQQAARQATEQAHAQMAAQQQAARQAAEQARAQMASAQQASARATAQATARAQAVAASQRQDQTHPGAPHGDPRDRSNHDRENDRK